MGYHSIQDTGRKPGRMGWGASVSAAPLDRSHTDRSEVFA